MNGMTSAGCCGAMLVTADHGNAEMMRDPDHALDVLAREELGLNPDSLGSPWGAAASSFLAFAFGALIPLLPILLHVAAANTLPVSAAITLVSLFGIGMILSLFTGRSAFWSGARMLAIGAGAGALTYAIGALFSS